MSPTPHQPSANRLLAALPDKEYRSLLPDLKLVTLAFGQILFEPGDAIRHVYFPNDSIVSLLSAIEKRSSLEVGMVGNEGMAGISVFMGVNQASTRGLVQGAGSAMRMKSAAFRKQANDSPSLHHLLHRYTHSLLVQISQSAACNRFHTVDARLARWLLMTRDRLGLDKFRLTQDFMSDMLGVRREGVNKAAGALQKNKLISYSRGVIEILDGRRLETVSCKCYGIIRKESNGFLN
jgi:CRP-like cAMP-binding protein